ncbi:hypothetical protein DFH94DRAFT_248640 [Russula ochroleuca]|uniref:Uncharacterized protein n=1 Tax=Russula ochroleuca TaxID=152965 RepID=A0A9P5TC98_9AGAM|nr:hypothetical protein DFH94DRAFT_248640 [Russula ochroleuca]
MPLPRCRNFEDNGSRKTWPDGTDMRCRPNCAFIHPSEPDWDRAPRAAVRGRGGPPRGSRGRRQSSFGPPAPGGSSSTQGAEWGSSSGAWDDYMTGFNPTPRATSGARGASHRSQTTPGTSGWGSSGADGTGWGNSGADGSSGWGNSGADGPGWGNSGADDSGWGSSGADGPGWGSNANINGNPSDGPLNEPGALDEQASSSQWDTPAVEWGSSGNEWGSAGTDLGPGWGETSIPNQGNKASSATTVANMADLDALGGTGADDNPDAAIATTLSSPTMPSIPASGELNATHREERGEDTPVQDIVELFRWKRKASLIHRFRSLWPSNRSKCDHRIVTTTTMIFQCYQAPTRWVS